VSPHIPDVRKHVVVPATKEHCFELFTERPLDWWPPSHVLLKQERAGLRFEGHAGGRWYEWDVDGNEVAWGIIQRWEPPLGLTMTWRVGAGFTPVFDDELASVIEVSFTPLADALTRVELAHVQLHKHGEAAPFIYSHLDGPSPGETLQRYADAVAADLRTAAGATGGV
jgi:hypothetical protein